VSTTTAEPADTASATAPPAPATTAGPPTPPSALATLRRRTARAARAARPHLVDRRGLTALGATALALLLGAAGATADLVAGPGLGRVFAVCFVLGCGAAALGVHREDLRAAVVMPPLAYTALVLVAGAVDGVRLPGSLLVRSGLDVVNALALGAPVVISATALALVIALGRAVSRR
jgi:hypothetical protein